MIIFHLSLTILINHNPYECFTHPNNLTNSIRDRIECDKSRGCEKQSKWIVLHVNLINLISVGFSKAIRMKSGIEKESTN